MRNVRVFGGSSHPGLAESICVKLGTAPGKCSLGKYANGEISVQIGMTKMVMVGSKPRADDLRRGRLLHPRS